MHSLPAFSRRRTICTDRESNSTTSSKHRHRSPLRPRSDFVDVTSLISLRLPSLFVCALSACRSSSLQDVCAGTHRTARCGRATGDGLLSLLCSGRRIHGGGNRRGQERTSRTKSNACAIIDVSPTHAISCRQQLACAAACMGYGVAQRKVQECAAKRMHLTQA